MIAIDGPAASGKTTIASLLADYLGATFLDTGLLYRAVTFVALRDGIGTDNVDGLTNRIQAGDIAIASGSIPNGQSVDVLVGGTDVTEQLRSPEIDRNVSAYSAIAEIRAALLPIQREFAEHRRVVMVGRDIASVVFPDAGVQIYLDASVQERAERRWKELQRSGSDLSLEDVTADLERRDELDSGRENSPLTKSASAVHVQTDGKSISDVVTEVARIAEGNGR